MAQTQTPKPEETTAPAQGTHTTATDKPAPAAEKPKGATEEMKAWVRREIELANDGASQETREEQNP